MIDTSILDGVIGGLKRTRRRLLRVVARSPQAPEVAEIVAETDGLIAKLESLRAEGEGRESQAA